MVRYNIGFRNSKAHSNWVMLGETNYGEAKLLEKTIRLYGFERTVQFVAFIFIICRVIYISSFD